MKKFLFLLGISLLVSCQEKIDLLSEDISAPEMAIENPYSISVETALSNLDDFLSNMDDVKTRSDNERKVVNILPIKYGSLATRASMNDINCENLLYVANFENEQGYAILAADDRIEEKVIAVTDKGILSDVTVYTAVELLNSERFILKEYPVNGPGFFTLPETGEELFMNPNTVLLYDEKENDTLVGNFSLDDIGAEDEEGNLVSSIPPMSVNGDYGNFMNTPEFLTSTLCVTYAINDILDYESRLGGYTPFIDPNFEGSKNERKETSFSSWKTTNHVNPILSKYVNWNQSSPFNDLYPYRRKAWLFGHKRKAPAGCFPLAISKILTHFEYPSRFTYNGYTVDWKEVQRPFSSSVGRKSAATLLKGISSACNSLYFYHGTFTFPGQATSFMRRIGMSNAHSHNYSFDRVENMVDKGCPLIIYSVPGINVFKSHSWNIDGYKIKEREVTTKTYVGNKLKGTTTKKETCKMVHCDFGWGGSCNGYYVSGVFKLNDPNIEHDYNTSNNNSTHYNHLLKVITYDKP